MLRYITFRAGMREEAAKHKEALNGMMRAEVPLVQTAVDAFGLLNSILQRVKAFHGYMKTCLRNMNQS